MVGATSSEGFLVRYHFGRPFVKRFAQWYRTVVLSVLSCPVLSVCLSVCDAGVLWPNGRPSQLLLSTCTFCYSLEILATTAGGVSAGAHPIEPFCQTCIITYRRRRQREASFSWQLRVLSKRNADVLSRSSPAVIKKPTETRSAQPKNGSARERRNKTSVQLRSNSSAATSTFQRRFDEPQRLRTGARSPFIIET